MTKNSLDCRRKALFHLAWSYLAGSSAHWVPTQRLIIIYNCLANDLGFLLASSLLYKLTDFYWSVCHMVVVLPLFWHLFLRVLLASLFLDGYMVSPKLHLLSPLIFGLPTIFCLSIGWNSFIHPPIKETRTQDIPHHWPVQSMMASYVLGRTIHIGRWSIVYICVLQATVAPEAWYWHFL